MRYRLLSPVDLACISREGRGVMVKRITVSTREERERQDRQYWRERTPEERLDAVELLRLEAGKFLYEYPARLRRVVTVTRKA